MGHSYVASPGISIGALRRQAPVRTALTVDYSEIGGFTVDRETWAEEAIVAGDPPIIVDWFCGLQFTQTDDYATVRLECAAQGLTVPGTVGGEPVVAVGLHLYFAPMWERFLSGGPAARGLVDADACVSGDVGDAFPRGDTRFEMFVDATQVADIHGTGFTTGPNGAWRGTLILPGVTLDPAPANWGEDRDPFQPLSVGEPPGTPHPHANLFWSAVEPGESLPVDISFALEMDNVRFASAVEPGLSDGPDSPLSPRSVFDHTECWVDVYPYIEQPPSGDEMMMVV